MVTIADELIETLKSHEFSLTVKDVREPYATKQPVYPMIVVEEITNRPNVQIHGEEILSTIAYRFEIYARDLSENGEIYTKRQVNTKLGKELDQLLTKTYGLKRIGDSVNLPDVTDGTILRYVVTYGGVIDNRTMIIYQN